MPFRRMPATDNQRTAALSAAKHKLDNTAVQLRPLSAATITALNQFLPIWNNENTQRAGSLSVQTQATVVHMEKLDTLRVLVSHFIQVFNLAVARGKYSVTQRPILGLDMNAESVPNLGREADVFLWAQKLIAGETIRIAEDENSAMQNPEIAELSAVFTAAQASLAAQSLAKDNLDAEQEDVDDLRPQADALIRDIWDEVEFFHRRESAAGLRANAREWGVFYAQRPGEPEEPTEPEAPVEG